MVSIQPVTYLFREGLASQRNLTHKPFPEGDNLNSCDVSIIEREPWSTKVGRWRVAGYILYCLFATPSPAQPKIVGKL
jgi:hypothetical protein